MKEIERKFLVTDDSYKAMATGCRHIEQGYLQRLGAATVRLRIADDSAFLTIKGRNRGVVRDEWEYPIPVADAREMLQSLTGGHTLSKTRYLVPFGGFTWEVDEFHGALSSLVVAEIELPSEDTEFEKPPFVGAEVTGDQQYYNSALIDRC